jgi:V8-like Glu-specific endopeptidase
MKKKLKLLFLLFAILLPFISFCDEGMWLPLLLQKNEKDMQSKGMKISAKDIYDANHSSLKDAVMLFGSGCTGEFVSKEGLVLTNHHCGYYQIVSHSTVDNDYLTNGFWAKSKKEEIPCNGLTVTLLVYMQDVTKEVLNGVTSNMLEVNRVKLINENIKKITDKAIQGTHYIASIKPLYYGNQYMMYVSEVYKDVRLVGAPPSNIGKFGGDTDNWMWPRHTGDFSMFRVYANKNNEPAEYSKDNVPYVPKKSMKISLKDKQEGDFTFVFGYPGHTQQFLTSYAVDEIASYQDPARIKLRTAILDIYNKAKEESPAKRLRYSATIATIANGWKKWQGEVKGLNRLEAVKQKQAYEEEFMKWVIKDKAREDEYGDLLNEFRIVYNNSFNYKMEYLYLTEAVFASDIMKQAKNILTLIDMSRNDTISDDKVNKKANEILSSLNRYYNNDYSSHKEVDKKVFVQTMDIFYNDFAKERYMFLKEKIEGEYKGSSTKYFETLFDKSFLSNPKQANKLLGKYKKSKIDKLIDDMAIEFLSPTWGQYINDDVNKLANNDIKLDSLYRVYVKAIMEKDKDKDFYPDANLTLRVTYGNIKGFKARDAVSYSYYTTLDGIMQKEDSNVYDYVVEKRLKELYKNKDYGRYQNKKGEMPVAFIATNHTTGGNSGSPVLDGYGNLIGINFDRNWEGTMSDIIYDKDVCRNISLDIRYCLFIIDKFAGAKNLIDEMDIVE